MTGPRVSLRPQYLRVRSWERYQHYKDRRPPWIKYHVVLLDDYELMHLPYVTRLLFDCLLLLAARTDNNIPHDPSWIAKQTNVEQRHVEHGIETLVAMRFLTVAENKRSASRALAQRKQKSMPETETETETKKSQSKSKLKAVTEARHAAERPSDSSQVKNLIDASLGGAA